MKKGNRWKDHYTERARAEKWLARSVYKLEEIDRKQGLIKKGYHVLDLGCYPGSWSQYCLKKVGQGGKVTGLDIKRPDQLSTRNFRFVEADIMSITPEDLEKEIGKVDVLISDMAPQTTGVKMADVSQSVALAEKAFEIALIILKKRGGFLCKVFEGEDLRSYKDNVSRHFDRVSLIRPSAVRKRSREIYLLGLRT
jgi:23S rRNA (uridine2552-2'-O)-methyltransferase